MNSLFIIGFAIIFFWLGYAIYGERIQKVLKIEPHRKTPAHEHYDGIDYVPAKHWMVLFGHHFSSIAGAGPIVGPILAVSIWGWGPTLLWVLLGTIFIGGVHDYLSLMASVRHKGGSVADFAEHTISRNAKIIFLGFVWVALILVISVFAHICAQTFVASPDIVVPSLGLIPLAVIVGILLYAKKKNLVLVTIAALIFLVGLIFLGAKAPIQLDISNPLKLWVIVLLIYCYIASILPVQYLLQPRDYISAYLLFAGLAFGYVGVIAYHPKLEYPFYAGWSGGIGEILWPALFVTVACGAVSGFHALVASGTTSKQLSTELDAKRIGYGAMVAEGVAAVLAILVVASAYKGSAELGIAVKDGGGPVNAFGYGYGRLTEFFLGRYGRLFAILVLNAFILTTLDTATRICRYITEELFKVKNRYLATLAVVAVSGWLGLSGKWNEIWPLFGAANQLIAALTMIVITSWFLSTHRPIRYIFLPMVFMLITTMGALILKIVEYKKSGSLVLMIISIVLAILAFIIMYEAIYVALKNYRRRYHVKSA